MSAYLLSVAGVSLLARLAVVRAVSLADSASWYQEPNPVIRLASVCLKHNVVMTA